MQMENASFLINHKSEIDSIGCKSGDPTLFDSVVDGVNNKTKFVFSACDGFFVLVPVIYQKEPYVNVLIAYSSGGKFFSEMLPFIKDRARDIGAKGLLFATANEKLSIAAKRFGWIYKGKREDIKDWLVPL